MSCELSLHIDAQFREHLPEEWLYRLVEETLAAGGINSPVELSLVITNNRKMRQLNRKFRGIDRTTDVLSFALTEDNTPFPMPPDSPLYLGEVIISYPQAVKQAEEYHHPVPKEIALLIIHGVLHLLGYDHEEPEQERRMRALEERILSQMEVPSGFLF